MTSSTPHAARSGVDVALHDLWCHSFRSRLDPRLASLLKFERGGRP